LTEGGSYNQVSFQRITLSLHQNDWQEWADKGLRYWHLRAYYLPMCYVDDDDEGGRGGDPEGGDVRREIKVKISVEDLSDWMIQGIEKGAKYHM